MVKDGAEVLEFPKPKAVEPVKFAPPPKPKEHYRVGFDDQGMTTLTLIADYGNSMTLSMSQASCEQLIKMLRSTYQNNTPDPDDDPDGGLPLPEEIKKVA